MQARGEGVRKSEIMWTSLIEAPYLNHRRPRLFHGTQLCHPRRRLEAIGKVGEEGVARGERWGVVTGAAEKV